MRDDREGAWWIEWIESMLPQDLETFVCLLPRAIVEFDFVRGNTVLNSYDRSSIRVISKSMVVVEEVSWTIVVSSSKLRAPAPLGSPRTSSHGEGDFNGQSNIVDNHTFVNTHMYIHTHTTDRDLENSQTGQK